MTYACHGSSDGDPAGVVVDGKKSRRIVDDEVFHFAVIAGVTVRRVHLTCNHPPAVWRPMTRCDSATGAWGESPQILSIFHIILTYKTDGGYSPYNFCLNLPLQIQRFNQFIYLSSEARQFVRFKALILSDQQSRHAC